MRCITIALTLIVTTASLSGCERYQLDRQMEALCKKDGGVKVYERVTLPPADYNAVFNYVLKHKTEEDYYGPDYRYIAEYRILVGTESGPQNGRGRLSRWYTALYRRSDNRFLGESIFYGRTGGDFFTFGFMPSSNNCPKPRIDLAQSIFVKGE